MREAQKMMNDPAFQAQMKKMTESEGFKQHMQASQEMLNDPKKMKEIEKQMQGRLKEGNEQLEKFQKQEAEFLKKEKEEKDNNKKDGSEEGDDDDGDKKQAAKKNDEEVDDMPDIPSLNLN